MDVDVSTEIMIECPLAEGFAYTADPDNAPAWFVNTKTSNGRRSV